MKSKDYEKTKEEARNLSISKQNIAQSHTKFVENNNSYVIKDKNGIVIYREINPQFHR